MRPMCSKGEKKKKKDPSVWFLYDIFKVHRDKMIALQVENLFRLIINIGVVVQTQHESNVYLVSLAN